MKKKMEITTSRPSLKNPLIIDGKKKIIIISIEKERQWERNKINRRTARTAETQQEIPNQTEKQTDTQRGRPGNRKYTERNVPASTGTREGG